MSVYSGDFLGFQLGNVHSSNLNITRVSVSDRYEESLLPKLKDIVVENPGGDGTYYFDTYFNQREFNISFAFDDLRDEDIRQLKMTLGAKKLQPLIFDESTYKKYMVKASSPPVLSYLPFQHQEVTVYKGEGEVTLIAYYPYGIATYSPELRNISSGKIVNNGDLPALLEVEYDFSGTNSLSFTLKLNDDNATSLMIEDAAPASQLISGTTVYDKKLLVNCKTHLIEGLDEDGNKTGHLYNKYITSGSFFNVPVGQSNVTSTVTFAALRYTPLYY